MQRVGLLNGNNITYDKDISADTIALVNTSVISGFGITGSGAGASIQAGKALIKCTRTNGEITMVYFENTADVAVDMSGTKKVYVLINQAKLDDGSLNAEDGSGVGAITTGASYPASNYVPLYDVSAGVSASSMPALNLNSFEMAGLQKLAKSVNIASATITDLSTATGNLVHITGTATINSLGIAKAGTEICTVFDGIATLTYNATSMILPGGANITTAVNDTVYWKSEGAGNWRCTGYQRSDGSPLTISTGLTGEIRMWSTATAPSGWIICDGSSLLRSGTYATLFSIIGTTFGSVDGTHFNIPDGRGRSPIGSGTGTATGATAHTLGATPTSGVGGEEKHTLDITETPSHTHTFATATSGASTAVATGGQFTSIGNTATTNASGGGLGHNIMSPNFAINFIIKT